MLKAVIGASEGNKIIYITNTEFEAYKLWDRVIRIFKECDVETSIPKRGTVKVVGGGELTFMSNQMYQDKLHYGDFKGQHGITAIRDVK